MKRLILAAVAATLVSSAALAGQCDVAGAIPDCEAMLSGKKVQKFEETSKLDYGATNPQTLHEVTNPKPHEDIAGRIDRANEAAELARLRYGLGIADRRVDTAIHDVQKAVDDYQRRMPYTGMH